MRRYLKLFIFFRLLSVSVGYAQWNEKDSLWLKEIMESNEEIQLSPETWDAIRSGTLIQSPSSGQEMKISSSRLPLYRDFDIPIDDSIRWQSVDYLSLPPSVFRLYKWDSIMNIKSCIRIEPERLFVKEYLRISNSPVLIRVSADNLFLPELRDGQRRGSANVRVKGEFSAEALLRHAFMKSEREKKRNRKRATAWKDYNMDDLP